MGLFNCVEVEAGRSYLLADLEEECYTGRHLFMLMMFGAFEMIVYVLGLPILGFYFMWRNAEHLDKHVVRTRYGLFLGGYRDARYYWEIVLVVRKVAIISISVFGTTMKPEIQALVVLLLLLLSMLAELVGTPFDSDEGATDRYGTLKIRYRILHRLEMSSLLIIWLTLWSGLLIYLVDDIDSGIHVLLSSSVVLINTWLMCWMVWSFLVEKVYEYKLEKARRKDEESAPAPTKIMACLTKCTEKISKTCPCLDDKKLMTRISSMKLPPETSSQLQ